MTIKNGDMPAMPVDRCDADAIEVGIQVFSGLTKREMMAMAAMQGILSSLTDDSDMSPSELARYSVRNADELLAELERTPNHLPDTAKMVVPEGWQLVPVEPTIEMVQAATHKSVGFGTRAAYQAMLAAASKHEGGAS